MGEHDAPAVRYTCDVLVIGSGVSGYCAAIQAGRCGCRVILVEKDEVLGGNSGPNLGVGITGADRWNAHGTETGLIHELQEEAAWAGGFTRITAGTMPYNIHRLNEAVVQSYLARAGVQVLKRHFARRPIMDGHRIAGVIAEDLAAFRTVRIDVKHVVIEASGDGHIGALAGAHFDVGAEGRDEFGERSAPPKRSRHVQGTSLVAIAHDTGREVVFVPPPGTPPFEPRLWHGSPRAFLHHTHDGYFQGDKRLVFLYVTETGGQRDTIADDAEIYDRLLMQLWAEWDHIKNGPHAEAARTWDLLWVSPKAGKRESRRFLGDVILTQTDLEAGRTFPDDVAYGGHDLDDHRPLGETADIMAWSVPPMYGIPFRACYSRNVPNLLLAGRLISATHLAHSSTRIMRTGGAIGQAVGMAAALCRQHSCSARDLYEKHIDELRRELLRADASMIGVRIDDPADLAARAQVTASSELAFNEQTPAQQIPLIASVGNVLWDWPERLEAVELFLRNTDGDPQPVRLRVWRARREPTWRASEEFHESGWHDLRDGAFAEIRAVDTEVPAGFEGWRRFGFSDGSTIGRKDPASDADRLLISVEPNPSVRWAVASRRCEIAEMVEHRNQIARWRRLGALGTMRLDPPPRLGEASQVIDGFHRRFSTGPTYLWLSDPDDGLPQELTLRWPEPVHIARVEITFDNLPAARHELPWDSGRRVWGGLVKRYGIDIGADGDWNEIVDADDNRHRLCRHAVEPTETRALRLRVLETHDGRSGARVYRVGVFGPCPQAD